MLTDSQKLLIIESIKRLTNPSKLEKDILDTLKEVTKVHLDFPEAEKRIAQNYENHDGLFAKVNALPTTVSKRSEQIQEVDLRYILRTQIEFLLEKEMEEKCYGQVKNRNP